MAFHKSNCYSVNDKVVILLKRYDSNFYINYSTDMLSLLPENERPTGQDVTSKGRLSIKKFKQAMNNTEFKNKVHNNEFKSIKFVRLEAAKLWTTSNKLTLAVDK